MERELTSLLRARGVPGGGRAEGLRTARVRGLSPDRPGGPPQTPAQVGRELARSVYECLAPGL
jgi:hypothetical protein